MPLFLFVVGVAMPFSFAKRLARGDSKAKLYRHIARRFVILWLLSLVAKGQLQKFQWSTIHLFTGTLQAIAIGYVITSIVILNLNVRWQIIVLALLLLLYWALVALVPVPGYGRAVYSPQGNLVVYVDNLILGRFQWGTASRVISSITFGCTVLLGALAGHLLRSDKRQADKVLGLFGAGFGCLVLGMVWDGSLPIIKKIWTSSFVLYSGGWSLLLLALFYLIIDVWGLRKWAFGFVVIGMNAIAVFIATRIFDFKLIGDIFVAGKSRVQDVSTEGLIGWLGPWGPFVRELTAFAIIWLILFWMYRKKTFIKI
jgi:predicted acyltransferase